MQFYGINTTRSNLDSFAQRRMLSKDQMMADANGPEPNRPGRIVMFIVLIVILHSLLK